MCHAVTCSKCQKYSWGGCGAHVRQVFRNIPMEQRCFCGYEEEELQQEMKKREEDNLYKGPYPKRSGDCVIS